MFQLDLRNNKSIYDQIVDKFKEQIMMGQLQTGAKMPSVRELSRNLGSTPIPSRRLTENLNARAISTRLRGWGPSLRIKRV